MSETKSELIQEAPILTSDVPMYVNEEQNRRINDLS